MGRPTGACEVIRGKLQSRPRLTGPCEWCAVTRRARRRKASPALCGACEFRLSCCASRGRDEPPVFQVQLLRRAIGGSLVPYQAPPPPPPQLHAHRTPRALQVDLLVDETHIHNAHIHTRTHEQTHRCAHTHRRISTQSTGSAPETSQGTQAVRLHVDPRTAAPAKHLYTNHSPNHACVRAAAGRRWHRACPALAGVRRGGDVGDPVRELHRRHG